MYLKYLLIFRMTYICFNVCTYMSYCNGSVVNGIIKTISIQGLRWMQLSLNEGQITLKVQVSDPHFNQYQPRMHVWCQFGDCSSNLWPFIVRTMHLESKWPKWPWRSRSLTSFFQYHSWVIHEVLHQGFSVQLSPSGEPLVNHHTGNWK